MHRPTPDGGGGDDDDDDDDDDEDDDDDAEREVSLSPILVRSIQQ